MYTPSYYHAMIWVPKKVIKMPLLQSALEIVLNPDLAAVGVDLIDIAVIGYFAPKLVKVVQDISNGNKK